MALEDYTSFTEVDPGNELSQTTTRSTWTNVDRETKTYLYKDYGNAYFNGDFEHLLEVYFATDGAFAHQLPWLMANTVDDWTTLSASYSFFNLHMYTGGPTFQLRETDSGTKYSDSSALVNLDTQYWITIDRDEAVGTYGTITCRIYSNSSRTTLIDTLSVALHTSKKDFQYLYGFNCHYTGTSGVTQEATGWVQNLDLQAAAFKAYWAANSNIFIGEFTV